MSDWVDVARRRSNGHSGSELCSALRPGQRLRTVQVAPRNRSVSSRVPLCHRVAVFIKDLVILSGVYLGQPSVTELLRHPCVSAWSLPL